MEIYNDQLLDLLAPDGPSNQKKVTAKQAQSRSGTEPKKLAIVEDPELGIVVKGLTQLEVTSAAQIFSILRTSKRRRKVAETLCNVESSRSHAIFCIRVMSMEPDVDGTGGGIVRDGRLNLVDLSGSENIKRSGAAGDRQREAGFIGTSLLSLGRVIHALARGVKHIPYRESKLTRILCDSLGGNSYTALILNITPSHQMLDETLSTLSYAQLARGVTNNPTQNKVLVTSLGVAQVDLEPQTKENEEVLEEVNVAWEGYARPWEGKVPSKVPPLNKPDSCGKTTGMARVRRKRARKVDRAYEGPQHDWAALTLMREGSTKAGATATAAAAAPEQEQQNDQPCLAEQAASVLEEIFNRYDANQDGTLESHEVSKLQSLWLEKRRIGVQRKRNVAIGKLTLQGWKAFACEVTSMHPGFMLHLLRCAGYTPTLSGADSSKLNAAEAIKLPSLHAGSGFGVGEVFAKHLCEVAHTWHRSAGRRGKGGGNRGAQQATSISRAAAA
ncbi:unnamed protein product [Chrysoparadoxa australica]